MRLVRNFLEFPIADFWTVQQDLQKRFEGFLDRERNKTSLIEWSEGNIGLLYSIVEKEFSERDARVVRARLFNTPPGGFLDCHIDGRTVNDHYWALNVPVFAPVERHTHSWYNYTGKLISLNNSTYTDYFVPEDKTKLTLIEELVVDRPYFVKVGTIHRVDNPTPNPRLILTIRFHCHDMRQFLRTFTDELL